MAIGTAAAIIGSSVIGGISSKSAANKAAKSAQASAAIQQDQYAQTREDTAPWREAGERALAEQEAYSSQSSYQQYLDSLNPNKFQETPYYNFLMEEGVRARDRSASSRGQLLSGGQQRAITSFGQGLASTEYGNYFDRQRAIRAGRMNELASIAGTGQQSSLELGRIGANTAANIGQAYQSAGNAQAAGSLGVANSINNGVNQWMYGKGNGVIG